MHPPSGIGLLQRHLQPPGAGALEPRVLQPVHRVALLLAPARGVAPHAPHQLFERLLVACAERRAHRGGVCRRAAAWRTGNSRHSASASASKAAVKPEPGRGHGRAAPWQAISKSIRRFGVSSLTSSTTHGTCNPSALVNSAWTPTLIRPTPRQTPPGGHVDRLKCSLPTCPPGSTTSDHCECRVAHETTKDPPTAPALRAAPVAAPKARPSVIDHGLQLNHTT